MFLLPPTQTDGLFVVDSLAAPAARGAQLERGEAVETGGGHAARRAAQIVETGSCRNWLALANRWRNANLALTRNCALLSTSVSITYTPHESQNTLYMPSEYGVGGSCASKYNHTRVLTTPDRNPCYTPLHQNNCVPRVAHNSPHVCVIGNRGHCFQHPCMNFLY